MSFPQQEISSLLLTASSSSSNAISNNDHLSTSVSHLSNQLKKLNQTLGDKSSWDQLLDQKLFSSTRQHNNRTIFQILDDVELLIMLLDVKEVENLTNAIQFQITTTNNNNTLGKKNNNTNQNVANSDVSSSSSWSKKSVILQSLMHKLAKSNEELQSLVRSLNHKIRLVEPVVEQRLISKFWEDEEQLTNSATENLIKATKTQSEALNRRSEENETAMLEAVDGLKKRLLQLSK